MIRKTQNSFVAHSKTFCRCYPCSGLPGLGQLVLPTRDWLYPRPVSENVLKVTGLPRWTKDGFVQRGRHGSRVRQVPWRTRESERDSRASRPRAGVDERVCQSRSQRGGLGSRENRSGADVLKPALGITVVGLLILSLAVPPNPAFALRAQPSSESAGLEELTDALALAGLEEGARVREYRAGVERVQQVIESLDLPASLTPGEVWMLGQLADLDGYLVLGALDQRLEGWIPPMEEIPSPVGKEVWDIRYRMGIVAGLAHEVRSIQSKQVWKSQQRPFEGQIGFLLGKKVIEHPEFARLRNGKVPEILRPLMNSRMTLKDVRFLARGDDPSVPRWKPPETEMTVDEAIASGAVGYKTVVMLPALLQGREYSPYWQWLLDRNLAWVRQQAAQTQGAGGGLGFGYVASAILWPAPPADFIPDGRALVETGHSLDELKAEMAREDRPAEWAIGLVTEAWLKSEDKKLVEQSAEFAQAHAELTGRVISEWNATPSVTLIQMAGPYFVQSKEDLNQRADLAMAAIQGLAKTAFGKIILSTRNRPKEVYQLELTWAAKTKLAAGVTAGRSMLQSLVDPTKGWFYRMSEFFFGQGIVTAAVDLLNGVDILRRNNAQGVWLAYDITRDEAEQLIAAARGESGGLEERVFEPLTAEQFVEQYGVQSDSDPEVRGWLGRPVQIQDLILPDRVALYVQSEGGLLEAVDHDLLPRAPEGVQFEVFPLPVSRWQDLGMILEDAGLEEQVDNPRRLPLRRLWPAEVKDLSPMELLAEIFSPRAGLEEQGLLGARLYPDAKGKAHLILFST